jgi:hypothetical protein
MKYSNDEWIAESQRLSADLWVFQEHVRSKQGERCEWTSPPLLEEETFDDLHYFYNAALMNNWDISGYVPWMAERRNMFMAIDAVGCLAALDYLLPLHDEMQKLSSERDQEHFWDSKSAEHEKAMELVGDALDFGRMLLAYAVKHSDKFGGVRPSEENRLRFTELINSKLRSMGIPGF